MHGLPKCTALEVFLSGLSSGVQNLLILRRSRETSDPVKAKVLFIYDASATFGNFASDSFTASAGYS